MTAETIARPELEPAIHVPGYCSEHPNHRLVTHRRAGVRHYGDPRTDVATVCPAPDHGPYDRDRCLWCGQALDSVGETMRRMDQRRAYCRRRGDMCRIDAHRARRRGRPAPAKLGRV